MQLDKKLLLHKMQQRLNTLNERIERDFSGGIQSDIFQARELKYWIGLIQRGEVDIKLMEDYE